MENFSKLFKDELNENASGIEYTYTEAGKSQQKPNSSKTGIFQGSVFTKKTKVKIGNVMKNNDGKFWVAGGSANSLLKSSILCDTPDEAIEKYLAKPANKRLFKNK